MRACEVTTSWLALLAALGGCCWAAAPGPAKAPTVVIALLVRNKAHTLPFFLTIVEHLNYPKDRLALWIRSDHNVDNSIDILRTWMDESAHLYHSVDYDLQPSPSGYPGELGPAHWTEQRFSRVMELREGALQYARDLWADFLLLADADALLTEPDTLALLVAKGLSVVAPMLKSDGLYANFWTGMTDEYYYKRTEDYKPILYREKKGCFQVPMVHTCVLIDLRKVETDKLTYLPENLEDYDGPHDDIITFAISANKSSIPLHVCNDRQYGFVPVPLEQEEALSRDAQLLTNVKLEALGAGAAPLAVSPALVGQAARPPAPDTLGFSALYMISLARRPERRQRMAHAFAELGLQVQTIEAVDGRSLNASQLSQIRVLPEYSDPYHGRPMTLGEIGCFLSHHSAWRLAVQAGHERVLVLEDDIRFEPFFRARVQGLLRELDRLPGGWDLVYLGRKRLQDQEEPWVEGSRMLVHAGYSYWTLGYALSLRGARKLLEAQPLEKLVPVDEYLPILFDRHPRAAWKDHFPQRDLLALSAAPLLLYPTHYTGEQGYVSDTEDSEVVTVKHDHGGDL